MVDDIQVRFQRALTFTFLSRTMGLLGQTTPRLRTVLSKPANVCSAEFYPDNSDMLSETAAASP